MIENKRGQRLTRVGKYYRGVIRYRCDEEIVGSNFTIIASGETRDRKPKYQTLGYCWANGYAYDTIDELEKAIDDMMVRCSDSTQSEVAEVLNSFEEVDFYRTEEVQDVH